MKVTVNNIIVIVAVAIAAMYAFGLLSPLANKYEDKLREEIEQSQTTVDSLQNRITLLDLEKELLRTKADSALAALHDEEQKRKQEKDAFNRKMDELNKLSTAQLASYFTERYSK